MKINIVSKSGRESWARRLEKRQEAFATCFVFIGKQSSPGRVQPGLWAHRPTFYTSLGTDMGLSSPETLLV